MRSAAIFCTLVLLSGFSAAQVNGQATIIGGYASTWSVPPGAYALAPTPLVTTPSIVSVQTPLVVGASSATAGNIAGASNSTLATEPAATEQGVPYPLGNPAYTPWTSVLASRSQLEAGAQESGPSLEAQGDTFHLGAATFQSDYGVVQLMASSSPRTHAVKTYTNDDLARLQQNTGEVRFRDKKENLN